MKKLVFLLFFSPFILLCQISNQLDDNGNRQGNWLKYHENGNVKYKGQFKDNKPYAIFYYYYDTGELKIEISTSADQVIHKANEGLAGQTKPGRRG